MAMVKYSEGITEIEGKFGGVYFRRDQCINHIQKEPRKSRTYVRPDSVRAFMVAMNFWKSFDWTREEINLWWVWCYNHPRRNKKNEIVYYHPLLAFLHINIKRIMKDKDILVVPPL